MTILISLTIIILMTLQFSSVYGTGKYILFNSKEYSESRQRELDHVFSLYEATGQKEYVKNFIYAAFFTEAIITLTITINYLLNPTAFIALALLTMVWLYFMIDAVDNEKMPDFRASVVSMAYNASALIAIALSWPNVFGV